MNILAVDSCSMVATGAIIRDGVLAAEFVINDKKTHSVKLLPQIENMLASCDLGFNDIDYFACTVGPGSFTGQRIGTATVKALAHACGKQVCGISSLEAMCYNVPFFKGIICPIMDARREQVYTGSYRFRNGKLARVKKDRAMALSDLLCELEGKNVIFLGDGVSVHKEAIQERLGEKAQFAPIHLQHLRGGSVAMCAFEKIENGETTTYDKLLPTYLRMSQAERELKEKE